MAYINSTRSSLIFSPTAAESYPTGSSTTTTTANSSRATTPEQPRHTHDERAKLVGGLMGLTLTDFAQYRADTEYYQHICTILFPGETPDNTTDTPSLLAKWQNELDIVPSPYEEEDFNFCTKLVH